MRLGQFRMHIVEVRYLEGAVAGRFGLDMQVSIPYRKVARIDEPIAATDNFPDGNSALMLVAARLRHIASTNRAPYPQATP